MNAIHPKKLLLSKWTAVRPLAKQKHFLVAKVIAPEVEGGPVEWIEIESVHAKVTRRIAWRELRDETQWRQGWV
ncbi:TIGR02450 family Trp-rich protein [soil metagenome]